MANVGDFYWAKGRNGWRLYRVMHVYTRGKNCGMVKVTPANSAGAAEMVPLSGLARHVRGVGFVLAGLEL